MNEELTLANVELTGEYRALGSNEHGLSGFGKVLSGPRDLPWPVVRRKPEPPEPMHDWAWACKQMLDGKKVRLLRWQDKTSYIAIKDESFNPICLYWDNGRMGDQFYPCRTDLKTVGWEIYEEPKPETTGGAVVRLWTKDSPGAGIERIASALDEFQSRLAAIEAKMEGKRAE